MSTIPNQLTPSLKRTQSSLMNLDKLGNKRSRQHPSTSAFFEQKITESPQEKTTIHTWPNNITIEGKFTNNTFQNATLTLASGIIHKNVTLILSTDDWEKVELILNNKCTFIGSATKEIGTINFNNGDGYWGHVKGGFMDENGVYRFKNGQWTTVNPTTQKPILVSYPTNTTSCMQNNKL